MARRIPRCKLIGTIGRLNRQAMAAFNQADYGTAEFLLFQADWMVRGVNAPVILEAKTRNNMGIVQQARGRMGQAEASYGRALDLIRARIGEDNPLYRAVERNFLRMRRPDARPEMPPEGSLKQVHVPACS